MKKSMLGFSRKVVAATLLAMAFLLAVNSAHAGAGWGISTDVTGAPTKVPTYYANSPSGLRPNLSPTAAPGAMIDSGTPLRKFVDTLPGLGAPNNLGQYIPIAVADTASYPGSDYYELGIVEYTEKMHSDLPKATALRGYVQLETAANASISKHIALKYPDGSFIRDANGNQVFAVDNPHYLGPLILATRHIPVRVKYSNLLPVGRYDAATKQRNGDLFLPVDMTIMGAGLGPDGINSYTQNRAVIHLHGGDMPWISDGTPYQWITPAGENTPYKTGVSFQNVPDMPDPGPGAGTLYWPNGDSARLMMYHDHASGITRLNAYAGIAAGYLLTDPVEQGLVASGAVPAEQIPLVIQDKTFVPADIAQQDAKWSTEHWGKPGDLWFPHVYETNQDPNSFDGTNPVGRWDYGPWFWPVFPAPMALPPGDYGSASIVPEGFMDTPVVNGTAYPTITVQPKAYRFRILSIGNDRSLNLGLYEAEPLTIVPTSGGSGYSATPAVAISGGGGTGATATATVTAGVITGITVTNPGAGYTTAPTITISDATGRGAAAIASLGTEVKMVPAAPGNMNWPATWPTDGREGGVPDPATAGPDIVQIGTEGGLLPAPVAIPSTPIGYEFNRRSVTVLNVLTHGLYMAPAERADAVIDFTGYCPGTKFILYNDAPAPVPGFDPRVDYYTGNPDQTAVGGAPSTLPGYGPNTRTVMQFVVAGTPNPACVPAAFTKSTDPNVRNPLLAALQTALPAAYAASQPKPIVGQAAYSGLWGTTFTNEYAHIHTGSLLRPDFTFTDGNGVVQTLPVLNKAIQELFDWNYGRMNATLGIEMPLTTFALQTTIPLNYIDPVTETINDGETQIWKITHNGVDTHPVHFHLVNVQLINRIGWDGTVKPPMENELGWKETVKMNPLEDVVVAVRPKKPMLPFGIPDSIRPLDPTQPLGSAMGFTQVNLTPGSPNFGRMVANGTITNVIADFGWEYVWHCHILGHEENDFMRPFVFKYAALQPSAPSNLSLNGGVLNWTDTTSANDPTTLGNQANEIGFRIERSANYGAFTAIGTTLANATSFTDTSPLAPLTDYSYRVVAYNTAGDSLASNAATLVQQPGGLSPGSLAFAAQAVGTPSAAQRTTLVNTGAAPLAITGVSISGAGKADFAQVNDCGVNILANASCAIDVTFTPTTGNPSAAMLTVATSSGSMVAGLSGAGQVASYTLTPTPVLFAARQIGTTSLVKQVTLANTGGSPISINSIVVDGANAADFSQANNCGASLAAGSCTINVTFLPVSAGDKTATVTVSTSAGTQRATLKGKGIAPSAELNPTTPLQMAFAIQQIGTTSPANVATLTNTGIGPLSISSVAIIGLNASDFSQTNNCPASLAVSANCTISVKFTPKAPAPRSATLTIATAAGQKMVGLSGGALAPTSTLAPSAGLTFALRQVATTSAAQAVTLTNSGAGPVSNSSIMVGGANAADFAQTNNCPATMAAGAKCTINVTFKPTAVGARAATLDVVDSAGTQSVALNGTGQAALSSTLSVAALDYPAQQAGTASAAQPAVLTNTGALALPVNSIAVGGANAADFSLTENCGASLAAGAASTCTINVAFNPTAAGARTATLTVTDAAGTHTVALSGTGVAPSSSLMPVAPLVFADQQEGTSGAAKTVVLSNTGIGPLPVTGIAFGGANAADFAQTNTCAASLPVGITGTCTINVTFHPVTPGAKAATLNVTDAAGTHTVDLSGTGVAPTASLAPALVAFADQQEGTFSAAKAVVLTNTGLGPFSITGIVIGGANAADFVQTNDCAASLAAGGTGTCTINVAFAPAAPGAKVAVLTVTGAAGTYTADLNGTGVAPAASLTPAPLAFADQQEGTSSAAKTVVLANTGLGPFSITGIAIGGANAADFTQTNTCAASLDAGAAGTCTINVAFAPATPGAKVATLTVTGAAGTYTADLNGTGVAPAASLTPALLAFADQQEGTSGAAKAVVLANTGLGPFSITGIAIGGANAADFTQTNTCAASLDAGAAGTCTINVAFAPAAPGAKVAVLTVTGTAGTYTADLNGTGVAPTASLTPVAPFALQQVGTTSAAQQAMLANTGLGPLAVTGITIGGANAADFAQSNNCGASLAVGASCTIDVTFKPGLHGDEVAELSVADAAGTQVIALSGKGTTSTSTLTPATPLVFALQQVGTASAVQQATLTNTGVGPLTVASIAVGGANADFTQSNDCGTSVAVGASCTISVTYKPSATGPGAAMLTVVDGAGTSSVALSGAGAAPAAMLSPTTPLVFADQQVGVASATQPVTLTNTGVGPLAISRIMIGGSNPTNFLQSHDCGTGLAVGASCTINVAFKPDAPGAKAATLTVTHAAGIHTVDMSSSGATPSATLTPAGPLTFVGQQVGTTSVAQPVTLTNTGVVPLQVNSIRIGGTNPANFLQANNNCKSILAAGASCTINVAFKPNAVGARTAMLVVDHSAGIQRVALDGTGAEPSVTLTPTAPLTFAAQRVGTTSAAQPVTLTNMGISPLTVTSITINGADAADFVQAQNCGATVAVGASCTINVRFKPGMDGAKTAMLVVVDGAGTQAVNLSGTGATPSATLTPAASLAFAAQQVGTTSATQAVTLSNSGIISLPVSSIRIGGVNPANFLQAHNCGAVLAPGASCTIDVAFKPSAAGARTATLIVADAAGTQKVALEGAGAAPSATLAPATPLTFAAQQVGTASAVQTVTLTNSGVGPLSVASIAVTGANRASFSQSNDCGATLLAGASCTIDVTFKPKAAGALAAMLTVADAAGTRTVGLDGTGAAPSVTLTPATSLTFAAQQIGTAGAVQTVTLANSGVGPLPVASIAIGGANPLNFSQTNNCGASLAAGASCTIDVAFNPKVPGALAAMLTVANAAGTQTVGLDGTGATPSATLAPAASLAFAAQQIGAASAVQPVTLTNSGAGPLSVAGITIGGANPASFSQANNCGASLAAGASCTIDVAFSPKAAGALTAVLMVADTAGTQKITLEGTGATPSAMLTPAASLAFAAQQVGTASATQPVTLTNSGVGPLSVANIAIGGANPLNFSQTNNCGTSLAAGASCTIDVAFKPNAAGARKAMLIVVDAAGNRTVTLDGTGQ